MNTLNTLQEYKLSEILTLAMPAYVANINDPSKQKINLAVYNAPLGNMCVRLSYLTLAGKLQPKEEKLAQAVIQCILGEHKYLAQYLHSLGRKTTALAQIRFYRALIKQLQKEGK